MYVGQLGSLTTPQYRPLSRPGTDPAATRAGTAKAPVEGAKAARDMESLFLKILWQEMWQTVGNGQGAGKGSFLPGGLAGDIYKDILLSGLSDRMADAGGVGVAKLITTHLR